VTSDDRVLQAIRDDVREIRAAVLGDPTDTDKPGLHLRVDRLERTAAAQSRMLWVVVGAVVASGATFFLTGG